MQMLPKKKTFYCGAVFDFFSMFNVLKVSSLGFLNNVNILQYEQCNSSIIKTPEINMKFISFLEAKISSGNFVS